MSAVVPEQNTQVPQQPPPILATTPVQKNNKFLKIAVIGLVVMLIIILSEVGYLVFSGYGRTYFDALRKPTLLTPVTQSPPEDLMNSLLPKEGVFPNKAKIFLGIFDHLAQNKDDFVLGATADITTTGTVVEILELDGVYKYQITVRNNAGQTLVYELTEEEIENAEIYLSVLDSYQQMEFDEILPGDKLVVRLTTSFLDNSPHSKLLLLVTRE